MWSHLLSPHKLWESIFWLIYIYLRHYMFARDARRRRLKHPTLTKPKMEACARPSKRVWCIFDENLWIGLKGIKWLFLWVNVRLGLLAIFGKFIKKMAFAFMHSFIKKKVSQFSAKVYIGRGPISTHSTPRVSTKPTTNTQSSANAKTPNPKAWALGSLHRTTLQSPTYINKILPFLLMNVGLVPRN